MLNDLKQFIDFAEKDRKYVPNTATGFRVAISVFEPELNEQEKESLQTFKEHIEAIYKEVYRKNQKNLSSKTILEYKRRILRLINDYEQYGNDPNGSLVSSTTSYKTECKTKKNQASTKDR